jgi:tripartite-type tricarboxylate transporter receptor subunit TctC
VYCRRIRQVNEESVMNVHARAFVATALIFAVVAPLRAQDYPKGPISLVIPLAPGDTTDLVGRTVADDLSRELKVPIVAVNRPGAGGGLGTNIVVKAKNDGYTIVLANNAALIFRSLIDPASTGYDPLKDLTPLGLAMRSPSTLAVRADAPYQSLQELIAYAKKNPGAVRVGTAGVGSVGDFCVKVINSVAGTDITMVPYTGATPAVTALRGGHIEGLVLALGTLASHFRSGALRGIVISSKYPDFPDIPTLPELGYKQPLFDVWAGFLAPANVPAEVTNALVPALERAIKSPALAAKLRPLGILIDYSGPEKMFAEIRDEHKRVQDIGRQAGLIK